MKRMTLLLTALTLLTGCDVQSEFPAAQDVETEENAFSLTGMVYSISDSSLLLQTENQGKVTVSGESMTLPENLQIGDTVQVTYSGEILETYPAQIVSAEQTKILEKTEQNLQFVSYTLETLHDDSYFLTFLLPDDWTVQEHQPEENYDALLNLYPPDEPEHGARIFFTNFLGLCGTGLEISDAEINGMQARRYSEGDWLYGYTLNAYPDCQIAFHMTAEQRETYAAGIDWLLQTLEIQ